MTGRKRQEDTTPLTWRSLTGPSRVMVPYYFLAATTAAWVYIFDPQGRVALQPGLTGARLLVGGHMAWWGVLFGGIAAGIVVAFLTRRRWVLGLTLFAGSVLMVLWTATSIISVFRNDAAGLMGPIWLFGIALAFRASGYSVTTKEA